MSKFGVKKKATKKTKRTGYTVRALLRGGSAEKAGICIGDTITKVDGRSVAARGSLGKVLRTFKKGTKVSISLTRLDGRSVFRARRRLASTTANVRLLTRRFTKPL